MDDNWDDLRLFLAVAREGTLTKAGTALRLDPATLGRRVARLEAALGTALFVKSPQGYALTAAGAELRERAGAAETAMRMVTERMVPEDERLRGQVRIGAPDGAGNYLLPQVCAQIAEENPDLDIQIVALPRLFNLSQREADMAIGVSPPTAARLKVRRISPYKLHFAASEDYLRSAPPVRKPSDLRPHRIVGYVPDMIFDKELDYLDPTYVDRVTLASNSVSVQLNLILQGGGVGVVHDFVLPFAPSLRRLLVDEISIERTFYLIRHEMAARSPMLDRFADLICAKMRAEVARLEGLAVGR